MGISPSTEGRHSLVPPSPSRSMSAAMRRECAITEGQRPRVGDQPGERITSSRRIPQYCAGVRPADRRAIVSCTRDLNCAAARSGAERYPHSSLAAACAAVMTAACRARLSSAHRAFQLPAVPEGDACSIARYGSNSDAPVLGWASIHTFAAWQAWKYSSSVEFAGTSTLVVTPAGDRPMAPAGADVAPLRADEDGADDDVGLTLPASWEQPAVADRPSNPTARRTVPHSRGRRV
jgi:hypothetical protein